MSDAEVVPRPPPDAATALRKQGWKHALPVAVMTLAGAVVGFLGARHGVDLMLPLPGSRWLKLLVILWVVPAWLLAVAWHEWGHVVGGWCGGGRLLLWVVGPFKVQRTPAGLRVGWNRSVNLGGGLAACLPTDPRSVTPRLTAVMILGGPLFSLVLAVGALWVAAGLAATPGLPGLGVVLSQHFAVITAGLSALICLVTLAPATVGGFKTDGRRAWDLLRGDLRSDQEAALLILTTASLSGQRPADYDPDLVRRAGALRDGSLFDLYASLALFAHAADRGEWRTAQAHLDHLMAGEDKLAPYVRASVRCDYAWLMATRTSDAACARAWLDSAGEVAFDPATRHRAEAAVLLAEGRVSEAAKAARAGLHALEHRSLSPVVNPFAREQLTSVLAQAEAKETASGDNV